MAAFCMRTRRITFVTLIDLVSSFSHVQHGDVDSSAMPPLTETTPNVAERTYPSPSQYGNEKLVPFNDVLPPAHSLLATSTSQVIAATPPALSFSSLLSSQDSTASLPAHPLEAAMSSSKAATLLPECSMSSVLSFATPIPASPQLDLTPYSSSVSVPHVLPVVPHSLSPCSSLLCPPSPELPTAGFSGMVSVTSVDSPFSFHVVLSSKQSSELQHQLTAMATSFTYPPVDDFHPSLGSYCCAPFLGSYHRALVQEVLEGEFRQVLFIDFGNREILAERLLPLPWELRVTPAQAIRCRLGDVMPPLDQGLGWPYQSACAFSELVMERQVEMTVKVIYKLTYPTRDWRHQGSL